MIKDLNPNQKHILFHQFSKPVQKKSFFLKIKDFLISSWNKVKLWFNFNWKIKNKDVDPGGIDYTTDYINSKIY